MSDDSPTMPERPATLVLPAGDRVAERADAVGEVIGRFAITGRLGEGGMGVVLAARDPDLGRGVAIKVVRAEIDQPGYRRRLLREAAAMARVDHPNVVRLYEIGSDRGRMFVAMELVDGITLSAWLHARPRSTSEIVAMFASAGEGLAAVHRAGLVHRDFKPENVLVDRDGHPRVADFGLARLDDDGDPGAAPSALAASLTRTGVKLGTPGYMAPEQLDGREVDARADQYAFCVALREALLRWPAAGEAVDWRDVPDHVRAALGRGLADAPEGRFPSMRELLDALAHVRSRRRSWIARVAGGVGVAGCFAIAAVAASRRADPIAEGEPRSTGSAQTEAQPAQVPSTPAPSSPRPSPPRAERGSNAMAPTARVGATESHLRSTTSGGADRTTESHDPSSTLSSGSDRTPHHTAVDPKRATEAHEAALVAIRELGYSGLRFTGDTFDEDVRELRAKIATETDALVRGRLGYGLGAELRRHGDCAGAVATWRPARSALAEASEKELASPPLAGAPAMAWKQRLGAMTLLVGRMQFGEGLCEVAAVHPAAAQQRIDQAVRNLIGASERELAEVHLARGIAMMEAGDHERAHDELLVAGRHGDDAMRAMVTAYARAIGLAL